MNTDDRCMLDLCSDPTSIYYQPETPNPEAEAVAAKADAFELETLLLEAGDDWRIYARALRSRFPDAYYYVGDEDEA
jgi:hypothetical protein